MNTSTTKPELSVVILCYEAGDFVPEFVAAMKHELAANNLHSYELVLVANYNEHRAATDPTPGIVKAMAAQDPTITVVSHAKKGMMGWDMRSGLSAATGNVIAVIDGDGQMPPKDVIDVYNLLRSGPFDMAKTFRKKRYDNIWRLIISTVYNLFLKILFPKVSVRDANSKPKIFKRAALNAMVLNANDWFIDAEIIIQACYRNFKIAESPTVFYLNTRRPSFVRVSAIFEFIKNLILYRVKHLHGIER